MTTEEERGRRVTARKKDSFSGGGGLRVSNVPHIFLAWVAAWCRKKGNDSIVFFSLRMPHGLLQRRNSYNRIERPKREKKKLSLFFLVYLPWKEMRAKTF